MGWKLSAIIIDEPYLGPEESLLEILGLSGLEVDRSTDLESALYPETLNIGRFEKCLIVTHPDLPLDFLSDGFSELEQRLIHTFPHAQILSIGLHSVVNYYHYAYIKDSKKRRVRYGSAEDGIIMEFGDMLQEEKRAYSDSYENQNLDIIIRENGNEYTHDQYGEEFVFKFSKRLLGKRLDNLDLWEIEMVEFQAKKVDNFFSRVGKRIWDSSSKNDY